MALKAGVLGRQVREGRTGQLWEAPPASYGEARGCRGASGQDHHNSILASLRSSPAVPRGSCLGLWGLQPAVGGSHMMAQRLRRSAPWKRRAACTCLQRAQPTLLSSSLNSSRICQLYLAEHST